MFAAWATQMSTKARPPARNGTMWYAVEPLVSEYLAPFVPYKICQEQQVTKTAICVC